MPVEVQWTVTERVEGLEALLDRVCSVCFSLEGINNVGMTVRIASNEEVRALNRDMRGIDRVTDVLSFPTVRFSPGTTARENTKKLRREFDPALGFINLGDCVISLERAKEQAEEYMHSLKRELGYLAAHSAFHLMGYDHIDPGDKVKMRAMEERAMELVSLRRE